MQLIYSTNLINLHKNWQAHTRERICESLYPYSRQELSETLFQRRSSSHALRIFPPSTDLFVVRENCKERRGNAARCCSAESSIRLSPLKLQLTSRLLFQRQLLSMIRRINYHPANISLMSAGAARCDGQDSLCRGASRVTSVEASFCFAGGKRGSE